MLAEISSRWVLGTLHPTSFSSNCVLPFGPSHSGLSMAIESSHQARGSTEKGYILKYVCICTSLRWGMTLPQMTGWWWTNAHRLIELWEILYIGSWWILTPRWLILVLLYNAQKALSFIYPHFYTICCDTRTEIVRSSTNILWILFFWSFSSPTIMVDLTCIKSNQIFLDIRCQSFEPKREHWAPRIQWWWYRRLYHWVWHHRSLFCLSSGTFFQCTRSNLQKKDCHSRGARIL